METEHMGTAWGKMTQKMAYCLRLHC